MVMVELRAAWGPQPQPDVGMWVVVFFLTGPSAPGSMHCLLFPLKVAAVLFQNLRIKSLVYQCVFSPRPNNVSFTNWQTKDQLMDILCLFKSYSPINMFFLIFGTWYFCELVECWQITKQLQKEQIFTNSRNNQAPFGSFICVCTCGGWWAVRGRGYLYLKFFLSTYVIVLCFVGIFIESGV